MTKWIKISVAAVMLALGTWSASATPITGSINFGGSVTLDTTSAGTATKVLSWSGVNGVGSAYVNATSGAFNTVAPFTPVSIVAPWSFNSGAITGFWSVGGFTFDLISSAIVSQAAGTVTVNGTGTLSGNGYSATAGTWSFSTQDPGAGPGGALFSFSAANGSVPDSGTTLVLLGCALSGVGLLRKKLLA